MASDAGTGPSLGAAPSFLIQKLGASPVLFHYLRELLKKQSIEVLVSSSFKIANKIILLQKGELPFHPY